MLFQSLAPSIHRVFGFGVSLLLLSLIAACSKEEPSPATNESVTEVLLGEWALIRRSGGIAGVDETYTIDNSPETITFRKTDGMYFVYTKTRIDTSLATYNYYVQDVTSSNDTTFFTFSPIRSTSANFYLSGRPMYLIDQQILQTAPICCDFFDYRFERKWLIAELRAVTCRLSYNSWKSNQVVNNPLFTPLYVVNKGLFTTLRF